MSSPRELAGLLNRHPTGRNQSSGPLVSKSSACKCALVNKCHSANSWKKKKNFLPIQTPCYYPQVSFARPPPTASSDARLHSSLPPSLSPSSHQGAACPRKSHSSSSRSAPRQKLFHRALQHNPPSVQGNKAACSSGPHARFQSNISKQAGFWLLSHRSLQKKDGDFLQLVLSAIRKKNRQK